jgi:hypothetical protein
MSGAAPWPITEARIKLKLHNITHLYLKPDPPGAALEMTCIWYAGHFLRAANPVGGKKKE